MTENEKILKSRPIHVIFSITIIAVMGVASITPALPKMSEILHLNQIQIGWLISAFTLPGIFLTPFAGIVADRLGRKNVLVPSLFLFALAGFSLFFIHDFKWMVALRFIQGIGAASIGSLNSTLIGDFYKGKQLPEAMGYNSAVLNICTALYPLIGGALAGFSWFYPFLLPLVAIPVALFLIYGIDEPKIDKPTNFNSYIKAMGNSMLNKNVISLFILSIITFIILYGAFITYMPFLLHQKFNLTSPKIGMMISISSIASIIVASRIGYLTNKYGSIKLLKTAFVFYIIVTAALPFFNQLSLFFVPLLFFGIAQALNLPTLQTMLVKIAPDNLRGAFMSINGMSLRIGQTIGPFIIGLGYAFGGVYCAYFFASGIALTGLIIIYAFLKK